MSREEQRKSLKYFIESIYNDFNDNVRQGVSSERGAEIIRIIGIFEASCKTIIREGREVFTRRNRYLSFIGYELNTKVVRDWLIDNYKQETIGAISIGRGTPNEYLWVRSANISNKQRLYW